MNTLRFFRIREPKRKKSPIEEAWEKYGSFGLTSVEQETHEKAPFINYVRTCRRERWGRVANVVADHDDLLTQ